jgi:enoyl-CoA hydratase/carnithine racemase
MGDDLVLRNTIEHIAILTLNHPAKRNALSLAMLSRLSEQLAALGNDRQLRVVILKAAGPVFSAGHDLRELVGGNESAYRSLFKLCSEVMEAVRLLPQPVIAQVHGLATAAGCQLVASCDLVVAADTASFATPGVKIGLFCTTPGVALARAVSAKKAVEMLLTGNAISAQEALAAGLVNRVVPGDRLEEEAMKLARQIAGVSPAIISLGKRAFYEQIALDRPAAYAAAEKVMVKNALEDDAQEGMQAFLEKRPPKWQE